MGAPFDGTEEKDKRQADKKITSISKQVNSTAKQAA
jgi:hypothetical protein